MIMIPIISTAAIIVTRTIARIKLIKNRIEFLQINIKKILMAELNITLRNQKIIPNNNNNNNNDNNNDNNNTWG